MQISIARAIARSCDEVNHTRFGVLLLAIFASSAKIDSRRRAIRVRRRLFHACLSGR